MEKLIEKKLQEKSIVISINEKTNLADYFSSIEILDIFLELQKMNINVTNISTQEKITLENILKNNYKPSIEFKNV